MVKTIKGFMVTLILVPLLAACLSSDGWAGLNSSTWSDGASSTPAQSSPPAASSTASLQNGRYTCSGTSIAMSVSVGLITLYESGYKAIGNGTYRINGSTIVISFYNTSGAAAALNGRTFAYTIVDNKTFSGNGETWVYTGF
jgi:hypothetical protein